MSCFVCAADGQTVSLTPIYSFSGAADGAYPEGTLVQGSDGNFYGTTSGNEGINGSNGTVFKITPAGVLTTLYTFTGGADGADPQAGLTQGSDGNFYGTASFGGSSGNGTVFKITPAGFLTTLYAFNGGADGGVPGAGLTQGSDGNFYGTTGGTVFQITAAGALTTLYTFTAGAGGASQAGGLTLGSDGNFYGTNQNTGVSGVGTVFKITSAGVFTTLHSFTGGADGAYPQATLTQGSDGNFYGVTEGNDGSGVSGNGTIFEITPAGVLTTLHTFNGADGEAPVAGLIEGSDGNFYGTTYQGGTTYQNENNGAGTVFKITSAGVLTNLHSFTGAPDGGGPRAALIQGSDGSLYGTAEGGGQDGFGEVFRLTVSPPVVTSGMASGQVGSALSFQIVATNSPTSFGASNLPAGLSVDATTGLISGTPAQSGPFTVGITATNSVGTGSGTLSLTVSPAPVQPPVVTSANANAQVGSAFSFQIVATNSPTSFGASGLPAGLSIDAVAGLISGTPAQSGTFTVGLSATNSGGTGSATLALTVNPASPVITSALTASGEAGLPFTYQIAASNTPTSFGTSALPAGLNVDPGTGIISGTPTDSGTFSVGLSATNAGGTGTAVLTITLAPALPVVTLAPTVPQAVVGSGGAGEFTITLSAPQSADVVVDFAIKGTAINGVDYQLLKASKKIKAGKTSKVIKIVPQGDLEGASKKVVTLVLTPEAAYTVGTTGKVKVKILAAP